MLLLPNFQRSLIILSFLYLYPILTYLLSALLFLLSFSLFLSLLSHRSDWGCKGKNFPNIAPNFFFFCHNFLFSVIVAIFCKELRSNRAAKIISFLFHFQTFLHFSFNFSSQNRDYITCAVDELLYVKSCVICAFCKAGRKDKGV